MRCTSEDWENASEQANERVDGKARFDDEFFKHAKRWSVESIVWKIAIRYRSWIVEVL